MAVSEIMGVEAGGFVVLVISVVVLLLGIPASFYVGGLDARTFRRAAPAVGAIFLAILVAAPMLAKVVEHAE